MTRLRRGEKAIAIKKKREEVEALRRALAGHGQKPTMSNVVSTAGGRFEMIEEMRRMEGVVDDRYLVLREATPDRSVDKGVREGGAVETKQISDLRLEDARSPDENIVGGFTAEIKHNSGTDEATRSLTSALTGSIVQVRYSKPEDKRSAATENADVAENFVGDLKLQGAEKDPRPDKAVNISAAKNADSAKLSSSPSSPGEIRDAMQHSPCFPHAGENSLRDHQAQEMTGQQQQSPIASRHPLWPPAADVSPVRPSRAREHDESMQNWFRHDSRISPHGRVTRDSSITVENEASNPTVPAVASYTGEISEGISGNSPSQQLDEDDHVDLQEWGGAGWTGERSGFPRTAAAASASDKASTTDDPLHRQERESS